MTSDGAEREGPVEQGLVPLGRKRTYLQREMSAKQVLDRSPLNSHGLLKTFSEVLMCPTTVFSIFCVFKECLLQNCEKTIFPFDLFFIIILEVHCDIFKSSYNI
jgi:hypothetical protein